jgi:hypothetical protein
MAESASKSYSTDPALYLYTSLTSGSSHIVTATSRLETILKANRIPFKALDVATDEKARMLWGRRALKDETGRPRKLPGLVQMGMVLGVHPPSASLHHLQHNANYKQDLVEVEEWNEYGELKQHIKIVKPTAVPKSGPSTPLSRASDAAQAAAANAPPQEENKKPAAAPAATPAPKAEEEKAAESKPPPGAAPTAISLALRQAGAEAAQKAKDSKKKAPVETFDGVGEAEPPKPASIDVPTITNKIETLTIMQEPSTGTWSRAPAPISTPRHSIERLESLQSPNSTAWKPTDVDPPVLHHRGSSIEIADKEEIRQIEEECAIKEEDEEDDE